MFVDGTPHDRVKRDWALESATLGLKAVSRINQIPSLSLLTYKTEELICTS